MCNIKHENKKNKKNKKKKYHGRKGRTENGCLVNK